MKIYDAIREMRRLTSLRQSFSMSFMSYNSHTRTSEGVVEVRKTQLRPRLKKEHHRNAEIVEAYLNKDTGEPRHFYHPLLLTFNEQLIEP